MARAFGFSKFNVFVVFFPRFPIFGDTICRKAASCPAFYADANYFLHAMSNG